MKRNRMLSQFVMVCLAAAALAGCARERVMTIKPFSPNAANSAIVPAERLAEPWWSERHQGVLKRVAQGNVDLLLIGDSITHGWDGEPYKPLWDKYFGKRNAVNMGFGGDRTQHVLWRLDNGEVNGIAPKAAMLMIGTNNSNGEDNTAEEIADGIVAICRELRERFPEMKILVLAIFPRGEGPSAQRDKNNKASKLASLIADNRHIFYMDINDKFLEPDGTLTKEIMPDLLHPADRGYQIWGDAVDAKLAELLGE